MHQKRANELLLLSPGITQKIWGGQRLKSKLNGINETDLTLPIGETWEVSIHPDGPAQYQETNLSEIITEKIKNRRN